MCGTNNSAFSLCIYITPFSFSPHDTCSFIQVHRHAKIILGNGKDLYSFNITFPSIPILLYFMDKEVFACVMLHEHIFLIKRRVKHVTKTKGVFTC